MDYKIFYSKRKTLALQISTECEVIVRAPYGVSRNIIENFVSSHENWIRDHIEKRKALNERFPELSKDEIENLKIEAKKIILPRLEHFSKIMELYPEGVSINSAKKRFGSCSAKKRINFSCRLALYPIEAIDYVVVHELAHLKHFDHSRSFWSLVEKFLPDYKERKNLLR
ncbi:MAG: M48 family metallopeptidase [Clostridia bacterium]|nr:M48 family metallopeptidase [Clostridia bacterium]